MEITPAILAKNESDFREQVDKARPLELTLHVDVMDGVFVPQVSWADPSSVEKIVDGLDFEVHLMVADPEHAAVVWLSTGAKRVWVHVESTDREELIFRSAPDDLDRLGLVINPDTPISRITHHLDTIPAVLVMGVTPGAQGQAFQEIALEKVRQLKQLRPNLWVKVDGGVKPNNIASIRDAGADQTAVGSALMQQPNIGEALMRLNQALHPEQLAGEQAAQIYYSDQDIETVEESPEVEPKTEAGFEPELEAEPGSAAELETEAEAEAGPEAEAKLESEAEAEAELESEAEAEAELDPISKILGDSQTNNPNKKDDNV